MKHRLVTRTRMRISMRTGILLGALAISVTGGILILLDVTHPQQALAGTCSSSYAVDWNNSATYTLNCGTVNSSSWTVKADTCWYTSPTLLVGGVAGDPVKSVDLTVRINQSGNLTNNDFCYVYFYVNNVVQKSYVARGDTISNAVFYIPVTLSVPAGGNYRIAVYFKDDKSNEFWEVKKGDIISCVNSPSSPLPVTLTAFSAAMTESGAKISWTTESEVNNDYFTLLRSDDGKEYTALTRIAGNGTTSMQHQYSFMDTEMPSGLSYYKLSQTDYDGTTKSYGPITIRNKNYRDVQAKAFPNPFEASFTYSFGASEAGSGELLLCDLRGAVLERFPVTYNKGVNSVEVTPSSLTPGMYTIGLLNGDGREGFVKICRR